MTVSELTKTLIGAWRKDNHGQAHDLQEPGENTRKIISSALAQEELQDMLRLAMEKGFDPHHATLINQEAERQAGIWLWDPEDTGKTNHECILLAFPATGDLKALKVFLSSAGSQKTLEDMSRSHLEILTGLSKQDIKTVALFPTLLHPVLVASLTAEARRKALMEILGQGDGQMIAHLSEQSLGLEGAVEEKVIGEAIVLVAAVVRTDWGSFQPSSLESVVNPHRVDELALGQMDEDFMNQAQAIWKDQIKALHLPSLEALQQPDSINQALLETLRSAFSNIRRYVLSPDNPVNATDGQAEEEETQPTPIEQLSLQEGEPGHVLLDIRTMHSHTTIQLPASWAFIEGEDAFRDILVEAMGLDDHNWEAHGEEGPGAASPDPRDVQGDHPAWKKAMPAAGGTH